jgi:hypothetical protein
MLALCTPNLMFPVWERVDTGRQEVAFKSGCRGFSGLVPQPLCMKSKAGRLRPTCRYGSGRVGGSQGDYNSLIPRFSYYFCKFQVSGKRIS